MVLSSCITPYQPEIPSEAVYKYVVFGTVTDGSETQKVTVSKASPVGEPQFIPVSGCVVRIFDDKRNQFTMHESSFEPGDYLVEIDSQHLVPGKAFRVEINTPDGEMIESDFDRMPACPDVGDLYYEIDEIISEYTGQQVKGIRFYTDLNAQEVESRFFRWEVTETWEYHVDHPREWYYDGTVHHITPPDYSRKVCWSTERIKSVYTLSTINMTENRYARFPLHFVSSQTPRLVYGYSILVEQSALSEAAYSYWDQLRINSTGLGGLYEKQPLSITGNLHNEADPEQEVLGFFGVSSVRSKRIFISDVPDLTIDYTGYCTPALLEHGFAEITPSDYPAWLMGDGGGYTMNLLSNDCVDCLTYGGTNIKPDFWPY
jgi:hypothetical protein